MRRSSGGAVSRGRARTRSAIVVGAVLLSLVLASPGTAVGAVVEPGPTPDASVPTPPTPEPSAPAPETPTPTSTPEPTSTPTPTPPPAPPGPSAPPESPEQDGPLPGENGPPPPVDVPAVVPVSGIVRVLPVEPGAPGGDGHEETDDGETRVVTLVTAEGDHVELTGEALDGAVSGERFEGEVSVPAALADEVQAAAETVGIDATDPRLGELVTDASADAGLALTVVSGDVEPQVEAAVTSRAHTADVFIAVAAGGAAPPTASVDAAIGRLSEFWSTQSNNQITSITRPSAVKVGVVPNDRLCDADWLWDHASGSAGFNRAPEFGDPSGYYWAGASAAHLVVLVPLSACGGAGLGTIGTVHSGGTTWSSVDFADNPRWDQVLMHEVGHNLGLGHSGTQICEAPAVDGAAASPTCSTDEYGDRFDVMGGGFSYNGIDNQRDVAALNVTHKAHLDALPRGTALREVRPTGGLQQTITLQAASAASGLRGLEIHDPLTGDRLYVEYRSGTGRDASAFYTEYADAFSDPTFDPGIRVLKIDCTLPGVCASADTKVLRRWIGDAAALSYPAGTQFFSRTHDATGSAGVRVRIVSTAGESAVVEVSFDSSLAKFTTRPAVSISGALSYFGLLTATGATGWVPQATTIDYQWLRDGKEIAGATGATYRVAAADLGKTLTVRVGAVRAGYAYATVTSPGAAIAATWSPWSISGTVQLPAGAPVSWYETVTVRAHAVDSGPAAYQHVVSASVDPVTHAYTLSGLAPGEWRLQAVPGMLWDDTTGQAIPVDAAMQWYGGAGTADQSTSVFLDGNRTAVNFSLPASRRISGTVTLPAGAPSAWMQRVRVVASAPSPSDGRIAYLRSADAAPAANGTYTIVGLDPGSYEVRFEVTQDWEDPPIALAPEYYDNAYGPDGHDFVDVTAGSRSGVNATLGPTRTISGVVTLPAGSPSSWMSYLSVTATGWNDSAWAGVGPSGSFALEWLTPGEYTVCLTVDDLQWDPQTGQPEHATDLLPRCWQNGFIAAEADPVDTRAGDVGNLALVLDRARSISGTVTIPSGTPAAARQTVHVRAEALTPQGNLRAGIPSVEAPIDANGGYVLDGLVPGPHRVTFEVDSQYYDPVADAWLETGLVPTWYSGSLTASGSTPVSVASGDRTGINGSVVRAASRIAGTVSTTQLPGTVTSALLHVVDTTGETIMATAFLDTTAFDITGLPGGTYLLLLDVSTQTTTPNGISYNRHLQYLRGSSGSKRFTVAASGSLTGQNLAAAPSGARLDGSLTVAGFEEGSGIDDLASAYLYERIGGSWTRYPDYLARRWYNGADPFSTPLLAAAEYAIGYEAEAGAFARSDEPIHEEWWEDAASLSGATPVVVAAGDIRYALHGAVHPVGVVPPPPVNPPPVAPGDPVDPGGGDPPDAVVRLAGPGRYETAVEISKDTFAPGVPVAYVASGLNFPDALAGAPAGGVKGGPVLLTSPTSLPDVVAAELDRLNPARIVVLGGTAAVSETVRAQLAQYTANPVDRLAGPGRYETAVDISEDTFAPGVPVAYVASGLNFPDALAGAPAGGVKGGPVLLTSPTSLPDVVAAELDRLNPARIVVLGGTAAVSETVRAQLAQYTANPVDRLAGPGRYETAVDISEDTFDPGVPVAYVASGLNFPDALAGAPAGGVKGGPVLLTSPTSLPDVVAAELDRLNPARIVVLGGTAAVSDTVMAQLGQYVATG